ncbi:chromate resistance protein [Dietzia sp. CQ4]|uniref:Chromate resistance protein ChrB n=1 Tax=Dietzia sp. (strain CQ4) TaxID=370437 RepID=UPI0015FC7BBF|nr:Chromate resistance protein ChrB [Dietzia sp. CQ4]MBB1034603.1 chromate resistance protein [Dietzia sp. CQ4]
MNGAETGSIGGEWVLMSYRIPREPSTRRIAVWRKLKKLGVAQIGDGLVALPADARTREHLDWIADEVLEAGGSATVWLARPASRGQERRLVEGMIRARAAEYLAVHEEAVAARVSDDSERRRALTRLRSQLRRISRRDYFPPPERHSARAAVEDLHPDRTTQED